MMGLVWRMVFQAPGRAGSRPTQERACEMGKRKEEAGSAWAERGGQRRCLEVTETGSHGRVFNRSPFEPL